jgi:hypothetical protein
MAVKRECSGNFPVNLAGKASQFIFTPLPVSFGNIIHSPASKHTD